MNDHGKKEEDDSRQSTASVSFRTLFRFASWNTLCVFVIGILFAIAAAATMPAINIIFGDVIDAIAEPINVQSLVAKSVRAMSILGLYGFVTFFVSFWLCGIAASNVANGWRMHYVKALLDQDMTFFDTAETGSLTLMLSESAMAIQGGLSERFVQGFQGIFQFIFGFAIAFYFGPLLTLVLLACVPVLGLVTTAMFMWGSEDGLFGKEAYEVASTLANEAMANIRTVASLNAEPAMSRRYDSKLGESEKAAIRQGSRTAFLSGSLFLVIFVMYGLGFWYGATLVADSIDSAMVAHPPPEDLLDPNSTWFPTIQAGCSEYLRDDDDRMAALVCACGLPWDAVADDIEPPNCGCGYEQETGEDLGADVLSGCESGGRIMLVFFSILIGGFSAGQIGPGVKAIGDARAAAAKMLAVIERQPEIGGKDGETSGVNKKKRLDRADVKGEIVFENLHFRYLRQSNSSEGGDDVSLEDGQLNPGVVFNGCSLTINAGETVALVGESGCGKSTIAKLVQRFYDPSEGRILLDGIDLREYDVQDLRSCIGVVSQEPLLFDTTIEDNIRFGKPGATFEEIVNAAKLANADDFIRDFPDAYQTIVGPKGGKLSGGQKQRVAIARAIVRDPPIVIFDEATSALDNKSERIVQQALDKLILHGHEDVHSAGKSRTIIVIAHRLSTVRNADKIVVLGSREGTSTLSGSVILEEGNHEQLMNVENGFYRALVGTGEQKSSDLVEDGPQGPSNAADEELSMILDASSEKQPRDSSANIVPEKEKETTGGIFSRLLGKKDPENAVQEAEEKKRQAENKARVWTYTRPELRWIVFGSTASIIKGTIWPLLAIFFSWMIVIWYSSDTDYMVQRSLEYSYGFYGLSILFLITEAAQKSSFELVGERMTTRLRGDLFRAILSKDITWFENDANAIGILSSRLATDIKLIRLIAGQSTAATLESVTSLTTGIIISATASWEMFLIMLSMVPALGISEALQFTAMKSSEGKIREQLSQSTDKLHEAVNGIREVQSFSLERITVNDIEARINETISPASRKAAVVKGLMMGMIQLIQFLVYAFAFFMGGILIEKGRISFEDFNRSLWAMAFAASGLGQAALFAGDFAKASAAGRAVFETLDFTPDINSEPWENNGIAEIASSQPTLRRIADKALQDGEVELSQVNFAYPTRKTAKIFDHLDLRIPHGKVVALVGGSGCGKSTVVQLIQRFYDPISYDENGDRTIAASPDDEAPIPDDGVVTIDDEAMRQLDVRWIRNHIGYVGQEPILFNDTIFNNIALGKPNCTIEEVEQAAKHANAYDFILGLEDGFSTVVGAGGGKISGGQKQRVAIARALVRNPKILILDEATSALDNESEKIVQESLDRLMKESGQRTTIVIAHRLSTIKNADCICVLENQGSGSRVVETGTHEELLARGQKYSALVQAYEKN